MTQAQIMNLPADTRVWWCEPGTPDHGEEGVVKVRFLQNSEEGLVKGYYIQWNDGEKVTINEHTARRMCRYVKKVRG